MPLSFFFFSSFSSNLESEKTDALKSGEIDKEKLLCFVMEITSWRKMHYVENSNSAFLSVSKSLYIKIRESFANFSQKETIQIQQLLTIIMCMIQSFSIGLKKLFGLHQNAN